MYKHKLYYYRLRTQCRVNFHSNHNLIHMQSITQIKSNHQYGNDFMYLNRLFYGIRINISYGTGSRLALLRHLCVVEMVQRGTGVDKVVRVEVQ